MGSLVLLTVVGARSHYEIEGASEVQDEVSRRNWPEYERALVQLGDVTLWLSADATDAWKPPPSGRPGGQQRFSDLAIETALSRRLVFRRIPANGPIHLVVDSTELSIVGEGEWAAAKHGGRGQRGWKKLHFGVDPSGAIVAHALTDSTVDDATTGVGLIEAVDDDIARVTADAAYDTGAFYEAAGGRGATVVVPPHKTARVPRRRPRSSALDRGITTVKTGGRRRWKKVPGYHQQARVEDAFFRYKSILGEGLHARTPGGQTVDVQLACNILNRMTDLGKPDSSAIGR